ncbi:MAG: hypothetical protein OEX08_00900 [Candidatus Nomurabacteria bacterium]|nr:hypothetical protein [Candidatus Nomurabacteria bacterium]
MLEDLYDDQPSNKATKEGSQASFILIFIDFIDDKLDQIRNIEGDPEAIKMILETGDKISDLEMYIPKLTREAFTEAHIQQECKILTDEIFRSIEWFTAKEREVYFDFRKHNKEIDRLKVSLDSFRAYL